MTHSPLSNFSKIVLPIERNDPEELTPELQAKVNQLQARLTQKRRKQGYRIIEVVK